MRGYVGDLSPDQQNILNEFRKRLTKVIQPNDLQDDFYLLRWLRARDFQIDEAEKMIKKSMIVRKEMQLDVLVKNYKMPEVIQKYYPGTFFGYDKSGSPILILRSGRFDRRGLLQSVKKDDIFRYGFYMMEKAKILCQQQSKKLGRTIESITVIDDMDGFGMKDMYKPAFTLFSKLVPLFEDNYPEMMKNIYVINTPRIFYIAFGLIKPFMSEKTKSKIQVLASNYKSFLLDYIDSNELPKALGGELVDENNDDYYSTKICPGGEIPKSYYLAELSTDQITDDFTTVTVNRRDCLKLQYDIDQPITTIKWKFRTDKHNIAFGVYKEIAEDDGSTNQIFVVPLLRRDCNTVLEEGSYICQECGKYVLYFDNTYSWVNSKKLLYDIQLVSPRGQESKDLYYSVSE